MAERDLLKYARRLDVPEGPDLHPYCLEPQLEHFRSLDKIDTLAIRFYDGRLWCHGYNTYYLAHFYPTLTTLAFHSLVGSYFYALQFAMQFPNLQNLTLDSLWEKGLPWSEPPVLCVAGQSPPLRGHFRYFGLRSTRRLLPNGFASGLPNGINFRSVEFKEVRREQGQKILDGCASSLQEFTMWVVRDGEESLPRLLRAIETGRTNFYP